MRIPLALFAASFILVSGCTRPQATADRVPSGPITTPAQSDDPPALRLIRKQQVGKNLGPLAYDLARASSSSLASVAEKHGADKATAVMAVEIQKLIPTYIERWEKMLADAYAQELSVEELDSIAELGAQSPHYPRLLSAQAAIGDEMRTTGGPVVTELVTRAFKNALTDAPDAGV